jgi:CYTH domain-containing protein
MPHRKRTAEMKVGDEFMMSRTRPKNFVENEFYMASAVITEIRGMTVRVRVEGEEITVNRIDIRREYERSQKGPDDGLG